MNWIKNNLFVSILAFVTLVICAVLFFIASKNAARYSATKEDFTSSFRQVTAAERTELYPTADNRDAKAQALNQYATEIEELSSLYDPYRQVEMAAIRPQELQNRLKASTDKVVSAFRQAGSSLPGDFFMGFERYRGNLPSTNATALLNYDLKGIENVMLNLAKSRPSEVYKIFRETIPEENGEPYVERPGEVARMFGWEIAFKSSEAAAREFISSLGSTEPFYYVVRAVRIKNERDDPPKVSDATFEMPESVTTVDEAPAEFGSGFILPGAEEEIQEAEEESTPESEEDKPSDIAAPIPAEIDTTRILAQVLGSEEVIVFVRFDLALFKASQEIPQP